MKIRVVKNRMKHLKFDILIDVLDFSHISFESSFDEKGKKSISNIVFYSLCNVEYYNQITYFTYNVYLSPALYTKFLDFCESELPETRPDGDEWQDDSYSRSSLKGNPNAKYFKISNFSSFFAETCGQWCPEAAIFGKAIVLFDEEIKDENLQVVYTNKDTDMLLGIEEEDDKKKGGFYHDNPRKNSNDWMDDSENYWNID